MNIGCQDHYERPTVSIKSIKGLTAFDAAKIFLNSKCNRYFRYREFIESLSEFGRSGEPGTAGTYLNWFKRAGFVEKIDTGLYKRITRVPESQKKTVLPKPWKRGHKKRKSKKHVPMFMVEMKVSPELQVILKKKTSTRVNAIKVLWNYIKNNKLQDERNRRNINCDEKFKAIFGKKQVNMFEMAKLMSKHLS